MEQSINLVPIRTNISNNRDLLIDALRQFNIPEKGEPHTCALRPGAEDSTDWATAALHEMLTFMLKFFSF